MPFFGGLGASYDPDKFLRASMPTIPDEMPAIMAALQANSTKKPSFFGEGGTGRAIAGSIGDALLQMSGGQPIYAPAMQNKQAMEMYRQKQADEWNQWVRQQEWKKANDAPDVPEAAKAAAYYRSIGRNDIADGIEAKQGLVFQQVADPATGAINMVAVNPASLIGRANSPQAAPPVLTDEDILRMEGGAGRPSASPMFPGPF